MAKAHGITNRSSSPADHPPPPPEPARTFDDALNDIDDCLWQIKEAADIMLDTAIGADIPPELFRRLSFGAKTIALYAVKAEAFSDEVFDIVKNAAAVLKGECGV